MKIDVFLRNRAVVHAANLSDADARRLLEDLGQEFGLVEIPSQDISYRVFVPVTQIDEVRVHPEGQTLEPGWPKYAGQVS